jgi:hypothetical protein
MWLWLGPLLAVFIIVVVILARGPLKAFGREIHLERARELFRLQREMLHEKFCRAASATGKPRGLIWKQCEWGEEVEFARDRHSGDIAALVPVTIHFEAVSGSDMEGLPAVGLPRNASAVFFYHKGQWHTVGKAVFNMNPVEALNHFKNQYEHMGTERAVP